MKSEDLINMFMEVDQDEEIYDRYNRKKYSNFNTGGNLDDIRIPGETVDPLDEDLLTWMRFRSSRPYEREQYDFIRRVLQKAFVPNGGYIYRDLHYLGYYGTMGLLLPNGFEVDQEETDRAWTGGRPLFHKKPPNFYEGVHYTYRGRAKSVYNQYWLKDFFYRRYVVIYSKSMNYPNTWLDDIVDALISDLYHLKMYVPTSRGPSTPSGENFYGSIGPIKGKLQWGGLPIGFLVTEFKLLLSSWIRTKSSIPWSVPLNFGFAGTLPPELIQSNWEYYKSIIDGYLGFGQWDTDDEGEYDLGSKSSFPTRPSNLPPSEPYNPKGFPQDIV